jgi:hypothetical protein
VCATRGASYDGGTGRRLAVCGRSGKDLTLRVVSNAGLPAQAASRTIGCDVRRTAFGNRRTQRAARPTAESRERVAAFRSQHGVRSHDLHEDRVRQHGDASGESVSAEYVQLRQKHRGVHLEARFRASVSESSISTMAPLCARCISANLPQRPHRPSMQLGRLSQRIEGVARCLAVALRTLKIRQGPRWCPKGRNSRYSRSARTNAAG